ncbi:MAG: hypothetical protein KHZ27_07320 [Fusobacterium sp.]|nr:hypothetical protein [Fusobacterium sp.]
MVVSEDDETKEDTTENCFEEILEQENLTEKNICQEEILQEIPADYEEKKEEVKEELENFDLITEKQYNLFECISCEDETPTPMDIMEETEIIDERIEGIEHEEAEEVLEAEVKEEIYEPKTVTVDFTKEIGKFETALEIKYSSLKLSQFPIKISNIPEGMTFPDIVVIGNTDIKIGNETIKNCHLKILSNESIKLLEIKHREFKLALSVSLNNDTIKNYGTIRVYEISSLIKYSRMIKVLEMLEKIFNGAVISFKVNRLYGDIEAEDRIELMKIKTIQNFFKTFENSGCRFQADKLPKCENIYYLLELYAALKENRIIETWCNFNFNNENINLKEKDSLIVKRKYPFDKNLVIEEKIILKAPIDKGSLFKDKAVGYRKICTIELSKAEK